MGSKDTFEALCRRDIDEDLAEKLAYDEKLMLGDVIRMAKKWDFDKLSSFLDSEMDAHELKVALSPKKSVEPEKTTCIEVPVVDDEIEDVADEYNLMVKEEVVDGEDLGILFENRKFEICGEEDRLAHFESKLSVKRRDLEGKLNKVSSVLHNFKDYFKGR